MGSGKEFFDQTKDGKEPRTEKRSADYADFADSNSKKSASSAKSAEASFLERWVWTDEGPVRTDGLSFAVSRGTLICGLTPRPCGRALTSRLEIIDSRWKHDFGPVRRGSGCGACPMCDAEVTHGRKVFAPFAGEWSSPQRDPTLDGMPFGDCLDGSPPKTSRVAFERKRPGVFETEDVQAKRAGLPCLLRGMSRHRPIRTLHGMSAGGESDWVGVSKCGGSARRRRAVRKSPHSHRYSKKAGYFKMKN